MKIEILEDVSTAYTEFSTSLSNRDHAYMVHWLGGFCFILGYT